MCSVSSLFVVDVQYRNPVYSSQTGPAVQQKLVMRQFSCHHISRLGNKDHPSSRELVRDRFSAFWLRQVAVVLFCFLLKAVVSTRRGGTGKPFPPSLSFLFGPCASDVTGRMPVHMITENDVLAAALPANNDDAASDTSHHTA